MIGFCGINCSECRAYKATVTGDEGLLKEMAARFSPSKPEEWVCLGCSRENKDFLAAYCAKCEIRQCALRTGVQNCAACPEFEGCRRLHDFIGSGHEHVLRTMGWLRARFLSARGQAQAGCG